MSKNIQNNQSAFIRVNTHIITKIGEHWGHSFKPDKVNDYVVSLGKFDAKTLENAMTFLRENCEECPKLATIIKACREHKTVTHSGSESADVWLKKRHEEEDLKISRARTKATDYYHNKITELRNKIEKWPVIRKGQLYDYIAKTAYFQAQIIENIANPGYMTPFIVNAGDQPDKRLDWWKAMNREAKDDMNVVIPWLWFEGREQEQAA